MKEEMIKIKRVDVVKKVKFDSYSYWCDNKGSYYAVRISHEFHKIEFEDLGGASPDWDAFKNFCLTDRDMIKELKWAMKEYRRKHPVFIKYRKSMSGSRDISLFVSRARHDWAEEMNAKRVLKLHISCAEKLNEGIPDMFSGDLFEVLYFMDNDIINCLGNEKRRLYKYCRQNKSQLERIYSVCGSFWNQDTI